MLFNKIKDIDFERVSLIQKDTEYNGSEWSKLYLKSWEFFQYDKLEIAFDEDIAFIRFPLGERFSNTLKGINHIYLPPMCKIHKVRKAINAARAQAKSDKETFGMIGVPQEYLDAYGEYTFEATNIEKQAEYLYNPQDLIEFKGKKYHQKRNHIAAFDKLYSYTFRAYEDDDRKAIEELLLKWENSQDKDYQENDKADEVYAIERSLDLIHDENIKSAVLFVDGKLIGFTLGEITPSNVGIVHIEKADTSYSGAYTKLVNLFAKEFLSNCRIINRQEDMGDEGIRQSKRSYRPSGYCFKYFLKEGNL